MMRLAIFDLDGTVLRGNSWRVYFWWVLWNQPGSALSMFRVLAARAAGRIEGREMREAAVRRLAGLDELGLRALGERLADEKLRALFRPAALQEVSRRRADGYELVLATGAFDFLAEPLADALGISRVICTRLERDESGKATGRIQGSEVRGSRKADMIKEEFADEVVDWRASCAFSDALEDEPLFALVGLPFWINGGGACPDGVRIARWD